MNELINSIPEPQPNLATVASRDPGLARAYDLAPSCDPRVRQSASPQSVPPASASQARLLPTAANGTDRAACASGSCEVMIDKPVDINVGGYVFSTDIGASTVTLSTRSAGGGGTSLTMAPGGSVSWTDGTTKKTINASLAGVVDGVAVLKFSPG